MTHPFAHLETAIKKDDHWLILGPGGGGCVHTLAINPQRPDTMAVSCDMTAGYLTHDGGESWRGRHDHSGCGRVHVQRECRCEHHRHPGAMVSQKGAQNVPHDGRSSVGDAAVS
jgi:hypothetical protein